MIKYILGLLLFLPLLSAMAQDRFTGNWYNAEDNQIIEIYPQGNTYYARIKWANNHLVGEELVLIQMKRKSDSVLYGGTYQDYESKVENEARIKLVDANTFRLRTFDGFFDKVSIWRRLLPKPTPMPALQTVSLTTSTVVKNIPTK